MSPIIHVAFQDFLFLKYYTWFHSENTRLGSGNLSEFNEMNKFNFVQIQFTDELIRFFTGRSSPNYDHLGVTSPHRQFASMPFICLEASILFQIS